MNSTAMKFAISTIAITAVAAGINTAHARAEKQPVKQMTLTCEGKSSAGKALKISTCAMVSSSGATACPGQAVKVEIDGKVDYDGYMPTFKYLVHYNGKNAVALESLNDGLETSVSLEYDDMSPPELGSWNVLKVQSVQTGYKHISTDVTCSVK